MSKENNPDKKIPSAEEFFNSFRIDKRMFFTHQNGEEEVRRLNKILANLETENAKLREKVRRLADQLEIEIALKESAHTRLKQAREKYQELREARGIVNKTKSEVEEINDPPQEFSIYFKPDAVELSVGKCNFEAVPVFDKEGERLDRIDFRIFRRTDKEQDSVLSADLTYVFKQKAVNNLSPKLDPIWLVSAHTGIHYNKAQRRFEFWIVNADTDKGCVYAWYEESAARQNPEAYQDWVNRAWKRLILEGIKKDE